MKLPAYRYTIIKEGQRRALSIRKVVSEDIGRYKCLCGELYTEAKLNVKGKTQGLLYILDHSCKCFSLLPVSN